MFMRIAALALAALVAACGMRPVPPPVIDTAFEAPYTLDSGDRLRVVVFGQASLSNTYTVDASGKISMPLIGFVQARGLTTVELQRSIQAKLRQGYMRDPNVAVEVDTYRPFFILGEVAQPGQYPYVNALTVETAVAIGGGFTPRAVKSEAVITRNIDGRLVSARVPSTYPVRPGDTIVVQERWF
ncbi:polysaccharide biosynthesis/export family protein [Ancylobacter terrae]|uniref:polysaccharide biosynthesis/export family protein n=1 Tax=Ancylobacter sp. sgz301288 TaxID=3342077 RepID=UPI00385A50B4